MTTASVIRFDGAWARAREFVRQSEDLRRPSTVLVRDLHGRIYLALDDRKATTPARARLEELSKDLHTVLGPWSPGSESILLLASKHFAPEEIFGSGDALWADPARRDFRLLDRSIVGADWLREPFPDPVCRRLTFFGIKGGVGRSTATAVVAWRLAQRGYKTLVVDLDLESPGVGTTLLPVKSSPDFGIVDWLVEDLAGQADEGLLDGMVAPSPLGEGGSELWVAPAGGRPREGYSYLPKLARAYADLAVPGEDRLADFSTRLHDLVRRLEDALEPDVVLLDSRAGLHDIAALCVTRLRATSLLFAVDSPQTWQAYGALFDGWRSHFDRAEGFRESLKLVAAQIPETETRSYLEGFRQRAYDLFLENLYEETPAGKTSEFNFDIRDPDAPHSPLRVHWSRTFQHFDPVGRPDAVTPQQITAAFGDFLEGVGQLVLGESLA